MRDYFVNLSTYFRTIQISFRAGETINLLPGFHAQAGSKFSATIASCSSVIQEGISSIKEQIIVQNPSISKESLNKETITVFPNPASGKISIQLPTTPKPAQLQLLDINGRILKNLTTSKSLIELELRPFPSGLYMVRYRTDMVFETIRLVVDK